MQSAPGVARGSVGSVSSCSSGNMTHEEKYGSADGLELEEEDAHIPLSKHSRTSSTHSYASGLANVDSSQVHDYQPLSGLATQASSYLSHSRVNKPDICVTHLAGLDGTDAKGVEHYPKNDTRKPVKRECEYGLESNEYSDADSNRGPGPVRSKKQRGARARERMRIELAPDQPPTTHGKQRERVYVACQQCRSRKIRCDGAKPMCFNCRQRGTGACNFDAVPRRRGPDRLPGARQRPSKSTILALHRQPSKGPTPSEGLIHGGRSSLTLASPARRKSPKAFTRLSPYPALSLAVPSSPETGSGNESVAPSSSGVESLDSIWGSIPPPRSAVSYGSPAPGSSGSNASPAQHNFCVSPVAPFAYSVSQDHYSYPRRGAATSPQFSGPRISTMAVLSNQAMITPPSAVSTLYSPDASPSVPSAPHHTYVGAAPVFTNPFIAHEHVSTNPIFAPSGPAHGLNRGSLDSLDTAESSASPDSVYVPEDVDRRISQSFAHPNVVEPETSSHNAYMDFGALAIQHQMQTGNTTFSPDAGACVQEYPQAEYDLYQYNPYQWAVSQDQDPTLSAYITSTEIVEEEPSVSAPYVLSQTPSLDFVRKTWWDSLLDTYCAEPYCTPAVSAMNEAVYGISVTVPYGTFAVGSARSLTAQIIVRDLRMLFKHSNHWFSFINVPLFFQTFFCARDTMQPALVLAILAFGVFLRSSNADLGEEGMARTLWLKEKAQAALDASVAASWVDPGLAQAAWILSLFEFSTQPMRSVSRIHSALTTMDNIIRALALTLIDAEDPSTSASSNPTLASQGLRTSSSGYLAHVLPVPLYNHQPISDDRARPHHASLLLQYQDPHVALNPSPKCLCNEISLGRVWRETQEYTPFWMCTPAWNPAWGAAEIRREECRRLCWSTLTMLAGYTAYRASLGLSIIDLFILHPSNYRNVFPGENLTDLSVSSSTHTTPETVWALYARIMLLWHACLRIRNGNASDQERAIFAHSVWLETDAIENALNGHTCNTERTFLFQGREYLFNARMYVSHEFRRFVPHPNLVMLGSVHRRKAEEWLTHQATLSSRVMKGLQTVTGMPGNVLAKRPFFVFWFMGHISRCLQLWSADKSLIKALELSKDFLPPIDYLSALWPCEEQRTQYARIRQELENACHEAGIDPLPPLNLVFPPPSSPSALV